MPGLMGESVVTGLRPWAVYQLRVFAENQLGKSKEGKVLQVSPRPFQVVYTQYELYGSAWVSTIPFP